MEIDPVVVLADELRAAEAALRSAMSRYEKNQKQENGDAVDQLLNSVNTLRGDVFKTVPSSALGAAELVRMVAQHLPFSFSVYSTHFHEVADRLSAGQRRHDDLIWLRSMRAALAGGICNEVGVRFAPLLHLALLGASRPIIVFRAVTPPLHDHPHHPNFWAKRTH